MNAQEYLHRMEIELKSFPPAERQDLLAEIASHIQSGQEDPHLGNRDKREDKILAEMGDPGQLGRGLRSVYRPSRFVDLLWVLVPLIVGQYVINVLMANLYPVYDRTPVYSDPQLYMGIRLLVLLCLACLLVGWRRRSAPLLIFWSTSAISTIVSLMTREGRWSLGTSAVTGTAWEGLIFVAMLIALFAGLVRLLEQHKFDLLLCAFAGVPVLLSAIHYLALQLTASADTMSFIVSQPEIVRAFSLIGTFVGIILFILVQPRDLRWLGLVLFDFTNVFTGFGVYGSQPLLRWLFIGLTVLFFTAWALDARNRLHSRRDPRVVA